jgi:hypothetical protein
MVCRPIKRKDDTRPLIEKGETFKDYFGTRSIEWDRGIRFMYDRGYWLVKHNHAPAEEEVGRYTYIDYDVYIRFDNIEKETIEGYGATDQEALMDAMLELAHNDKYPKRVKKVFRK